MLQNKISEVKGKSEKEKYDSIPSLVKECKTWLESYGLCKVTGRDIDVFLAEKGMNLRNTENYDIIQRKIYLELKKASR